MLCDSSFCLRVICPSGKHYSLKYAFWTASSTPARLAAKSAVLQVAGIGARRGPSQESSMVLPCVKLPLAMTTSSV